MAEADGIIRLNAALEGRYRVERELGAGGMATVYLAEDVRHGRRVALKVLRPEVADALGPERFLREIETVARLTHPHVLPLHDSGEADGLLFYVMPYVEGETLRERLEREGALPVDDALPIARECAEALEHAHGQGIIHRDLKPANILFSGGHAVVADFGIARAVEDAADEEVLTRTGVSIGTVGYMSPEQATGERTVDERTDVYALGCVLYEMLTGERAFSGRTAQAVMARQLTGAVPSVRVLRPSVSEALDRIVQRALQPNPADRYGSMGEVGQALAGVSVSAGTDGVSRSIMRTGFNWPVAFAVGVALMSLLTLTVWMGPLSNGGEEGPSPRESIRSSALQDARIAVFPFQIRAGEELDYLSQGLMELVSESLDGLGQLRRVDPFALLQRVPSQGSPVGPEVARNITRDLGAGRYVLGRATRVGPAEVQLSAALYSLEASQAPMAEASVRGELEAMPRLIPELVSGLVEDLTLDVRGRPIRVGTLASADFEAVKAYLQGLALSRAGHADSAAIEFERAVDMDSAFGPAWLRLAHARGLGAPGDPVQATRQALLNRDRLSAQDEAFAHVMDAGWAVEAERLEELAESLVGQYPEMVEGWTWLGGARLWFAWQRNVPYWTARDPLARALQLDPSSPQAHIWAMVLALKDRRYSDADSLYQAAWSGAGLERDPVGLAARATLAFTEGRPQDPSELMADLRSASDWSVWMAGHGPANYTDSVSAARAIWEENAQADGRPEDSRARARISLAYLEVAAGRWDAAQSELDEASVRAPDLTRIIRTWSAALPMVQRPAEELGVLRDSLVAWPAPGGGSATARVLSPYLPEELRPWVRTYLQGLLSARLGEWEEAEEHANTLERAQEPADRLGLRSDLSREIRALVRIGQDRPEEALQLLEGARMSIDFLPNQFFALFYTRPLGRLLRATLLHQLGRDDEALAWYANFAVAWGREYVLHAPRYFGMGEIHEDRGEYQEAVEYYRRFLSWWGDADEEYQPLVQEVRDRVARLSARSD